MVDDIHDVGKDEDGAADNDDDDANADGDAVVLDVTK